MPSTSSDSYSVSKIFQSELMFAASRAYGIRSYALRPANIQRPERQQDHAKSVKPAQEWTDWMWGYVDIVDLTRAFRMCLEAHKDLPPYDGYYVNAADTTALEDSMDLVRRFRPDLVAKVRDLPGRAAFISNEKARKAFGWKAENSWTRFR